MQSVSPNPNRLIPLDYGSVKDVPNSHSWANYFVSTSDCSNVEPIPIIDLSDSNAANLIGRACETWGFFHVTNHGVPTHLINDMEFHVQRLFSLPTHQKLKTVRQGSVDGGITGYGMPHMSPFYSKLMWTEGFTMIDSPIEHARILWPDDYMEFCNVIEEYQKKMKELSQRLMWLMLQSLGITRDDVEWVGPTGVIENCANLLQLNSYPACPNPKQAMGLAEHTDSSLLTVLHQSLGGLQVLRDGVGWVSVPSVDGAFVVNVGDFLHIVTNGRFVTPVHRAIVTQAPYRLSVAYFYSPPRDVPISPLKKLVDEDHPLLYHPVTWKEFLAVKAKHFNKAKDMIRMAEVI